MKNSVYIIWIVMVLRIMAKGQDVHFSQVNAACLLKNPAMSGAGHQLAANLNYKNQWQQIGSPYKTFLGSVSIRMRYKKTRKNFWGTGITMYGDRAGNPEVKTIQGKLNVAYHVALSENQTLGLGITGGFTQKAINTTGFQTGFQYDGYNYNPSLPSGETPLNSSFTYACLGAGIVWNLDNKNGRINVTDNHDLKATIGFSICNINRPQYSFFGSSQEILGMQYSLHGFSTISIANSNISLNPCFLFTLNKQQQELLFGTLVRYKLEQSSKYTDNKKDIAFSIGAIMRLQDAISPMIQLEIADYYIGINYDINVSRYRIATHFAGGLEFSLKYNVSSSR